MMYFGMCWKMHSFMLALLCMGFMIVGTLPVMAEGVSSASNDVNGISVPVEGISIFKYSPAGISINQPDGVLTSVSEIGEHQLMVFENNANLSVLTIDVTKSKDTLNESVSAIKGNNSKLSNYNLVSEENVSLEDQPAYKIKFTYKPENTGSNDITLNATQIISVNNGLLYVLTTDVGNDETQAVADDMIKTFKFIPIADDNVSKMVKSKFQKMTKPDKSFFDIYNGYNFGNLYNSGNSFNSNLNINSGNSVNSDNVVNSGNAVNSGNNVNSGNTVNSDNTVASRNNVNSDNTIASGNTANSDNTVASGNTAYSDNTVASGNTANSDNTVASGNTANSGNTVASSNTANSNNTAQSGNTMNSNNQANTGNVANTGNSYGGQNYGNSGMSSAIPYLYLYALSYYQYQPPFINFYSFDWK